MDPAVLSRARIRPARSEKDIARAVEFLNTPMVEAIALGHPEERGAIRLCEVDGELLAVLVIDPMPLRLRDVEVKCARIVETRGEDGRIEFSRTGRRDLFVFMLEEALGYAWMKRYPVCFIHGELALYPAHGFIPCFYHPRVYIDVVTALAQPAAYRVRHLKGNDAHKIPALRAKNRKWKPIVFASGVPPFHHFCVENAQRELKGYISMDANPESEWNPKLFIPEVEVEDRAAARTVLRHCAVEAAKIGLDVIHFPLGAGHPLARLCLELGGYSVVKGAAHDPFLNEEMVHLVDPTLLVAELTPFFDYRLSSDAGRALSASVAISTGAGAWSIGAHGGKVSCAELEERPADCVELPHWQFTQLLCGYRGVNELDADLTGRQAETLMRILPKTWPYSLPDPNLWEDVEPSVPFSKQAAKAVKETTLPWMQS